MEPFQPIPGKPPRKVVIDRQRKLFASLDIEELLLEFVSFGPLASLFHFNAANRIKDLIRATI